MIRFEYDNIDSESVILEFKCKECPKLIKTGLFRVPEFDLDTFKETKKSYTHKCKCGACYTVEIINGIYDGYGLIHGIDGNKNDVMTYEFPYFHYNKGTILVDTINAYSKIESIINGIDDMSDENRSYVYCLLFSNLISILESFIKIYTEPIIMSNSELIHRFSVVFNMPKGNEEEKKQKINDFYKRKSFQTVSNQRKLFNDVFNFIIEIDERIEKYVTIRDVIIHRNAIDPEGFMHKIKEPQLLEALDVIKKYIRHIFSALNDFEMNVLYKN